MRTTAHGISAGVAKMGGLWAAVWFNYIDFRKIFWFTACGLRISLPHAVRGMSFGHLRNSAARLVIIMAQAAAMSPVADVWNKDM